MSRFSFIADKAEYRFFAKDCFDAEKAFRGSFDSCVSCLIDTVDAQKVFVQGR